MKAAFIESLGSPEEIIYDDLPAPKAGRGDVLVRVEAVAVDPIDTYIRSGEYQTELPFPFVIGRDLVGIVEEVGKGASRFAPGDRVWTNSLGYDGRQGSFAEYASVEEARLYLLPGGVDPVDAVAVLHYAATAFAGLARHARLREGEVVFVNGGAGNVGTAVLQIATAMGARVMASASGEEDISWCKRWGAELVIDYKQRDVVAELREVAPEGVDVNWDTTGGPDLDKAVEPLAFRGRIVLMAGLNQRPELPVGALYTTDTRIVGFAISNATVGELAEAAETINRMLGEGTLAARVNRIMPLSEAAEAHRLVEGTPNLSPGRGRVVLRP